MPDLGIYWIAVVWCWIVIPHFIPVINEYTMELWTIQAIGLTGLVMCGTMSMPEGHPHHMDLSGWFTIGCLAMVVRCLSKLNLGG
jgi:hypothetical protein